MNLRRGDKLKMGPLWDFDLALGNCTYNDNDKPVGFWLKRTIPWYIALFKSPVFVRKLKLHFNALYSKREELYSYIRSQGKHIQEAYIGNELKWKSLNVGNDPSKISQLFESEIDGVTDWLETRFNWMKTEFDTLEE